MRALNAGESSRRGRLNTGIIEETRGDDEIIAFKGERHEIKAKRLGSGVDAHAAVGRPGEHVTATAMCVNSSLVIPFDVGRLEPGLLQLPVRRMRVPAPRWRLMKRTRVKSSMP